VIIKLHAEQRRETSSGFEAATSEVVLLNQESAAGIYKTITETQRGFCQTFELHPHRLWKAVGKEFLETI
jgi:hypothetical protein